jgi:hypothetical protein
MFICTKIRKLLGSVHCTEQWQEVRDGWCWWVIVVRNLKAVKDGGILVNCSTVIGNDTCAGEIYPTNAHKQFLLYLLISLHVSASRCHLQGVTVSLFISYSRLSAFRVGVGYCLSGVAICCRMLWRCGDS